MLDDQILSIDKARRRARIGLLNESRLREAEVAVLITLGFSLP